MKRLMTILAVVCLAATANAQELANFAFGRKQIVSPEIQNDSIPLTRDAEYVWSLVKIVDC